MNINDTFEFLNIRLRTSISLHNEQKSAFTCIANGFNTSVCKKFSLSGQRPDNPLKICMFLDGVRV
jgi:hypothetical protein